jgi:hypothetical protein
MFFSFKLEAEMQVKRELSAAECAGILANGGWVLSHTRNIKHWALRTGLINEAFEKNGNLYVSAQNSRAEITGSFVLTHPWCIEVRGSYKHKLEKRSGGFRYVGKRSCTHRFFNDEIARKMTARE